MSTEDWIEHLRDREQVELQINPWSLAIMLSIVLWVAIGLVVRAVL